MLHGHERSITQIKYNQEGDLLFSVAKDNQPTVWYSVNGERLGTYDGHNGAVWCIDVSYDARHVLTGSADNTARLWDCETGAQLAEIKNYSSVRTCGFSYSGRQVMISTDKQMGKPCEIQLYDIADARQMENCKPYRVMAINGSKVTSALWGPLDEYIVAGHEDGSLVHYSTDRGNPILQQKHHTKEIKDLQCSLDQSMLLTASKDSTAKLIDMTTLDHKKTYKTERPVNSAAISSLRHHVILGGGQEAMEVTTTSTRIGKFDARFFHSVFEEEIGRVKGHFGPINTVVFHPDGRSYSSGGEDGYIRIHTFDESYFEFDFDYGQGI